jgi:hypothetical protein
MYFSHVCELPKAGVHNLMKFATLRFKMLTTPQNYQGLILQNLSMKGPIFEVLSIVKSLWVKDIQCT